ncbi:DNA recombination protein RmuC [Dokdonella sp.]|uniref:DNA recombination protein RmuC n=1 Tax=Dokdonella sp. TaxID=2291710 RepID=UPI0031C497FB|nr:DNA recombination protein RmuC [Dokdonella sp.]
MADQASWLPLLLAALAGATFAVLVAAIVATRRARAAHAAGRASRDAEFATLAGQRDAAVARAEDLAARLAGHEHAASTAEAGLRQLGAQLAARQAQGAQLTQELAEVRQARDTAQARLVVLTGQHAAQQAAMQAQAEAAAEKLALIGSAEQRLRETFENLAGRIAEEKAVQLREQNSRQLGALLDPLKEQLRDFRSAVTQTHASDQHERGMLKQEIQSLRQLNQRISEDAINLTRALKGDTRAQGAWGELVLERVLQACGLESGREYTAQASFSGPDGSRQRPDVIVHLPDDKDVIVDSKVSLLAWERYVAASTDADRGAALAEHVGSLRRHIEGLSARRYDAIEGLRTLDFVLMFVPIEAAFIEAVRADDKLYTLALSKNVSLTSPSTLLATLRTVAHLWLMERRNLNAMEIARRAGQLHDNFALLVDELESVGRQLDKAVGAQRSALRRLTQGGKGSVLLQVQSLADMGATTKKELPLRLLDEADSDPD